ncbi:hypothetical protein [Paraburkholderia dipogonis]|uniref:hypothetical protein n=1 Tax=Paraburkholderia dipogonis TaxID=1211383 RepID=UPI0038B7F267
MNETAIPDSSAIADAMLKRTGETLREQKQASTAHETFAEKVISTLKSLGAPEMLISGQRSLDAINALIKAAEVEKSKPVSLLRLASYFQNEAPEGATPRYSEVEKQFHGDPDVFPLFFGEKQPPAERPAPILKGIGRFNGDGWKDVTKKGEVVFVWNAELPRPYAKGQYPRIGNEGWSASTSQYDFQVATIDEVQELFERLAAAAQQSSACKVEVQPNE